MKNFLKAVFFIAILFFEPAFAQKTQKSALKILFVGYDPSKPLPEITRFAPGYMTEKDFKVEYPKRMPAFKSLLSEYFSVVKTIDCRDWKPIDSEPFDVTIFDFKTKEIEPARVEKLENGQTKRIAAKYLPEDFSKPTIFIASTADEMGRGIGLKLDWLCLCLDKDAHHIDTKHPVFQGPLVDVNLTIEKRNTPEGIYHYSTGENVPKEIPMWRVQNSGYLDNNGARIGLVARGSRFSESPDTEFISSGVCQKDVGAVALGRHGNFFLWGFSASPADMTNEGKEVFVNTVAYMKQFEGRLPVARKYNDRMITTDDIKEEAASVTKKRYEDYVGIIKFFNEDNAKKFKLLTERKNKGETLAKEEEESLQYLGYTQKIPTYEEYIKSKMGKFFGDFGNDTKAFQQFIKKNLGYVYCDPNAFWSYSIDNDVKTIGINNHDIRMLDRCVTMLKKKDQSELALLVLKKYTGKNFVKAGEWENWIAENRNNMFFSETDGYRFMVGNNN